MAPSTTLKAVEARMVLLADGDAADQLRHAEEILSDLKQFKTRAARVTARTWHSIHITGSHRRCTPDFAPFALARKAPSYCIPDQATARTCSAWEGRQRAIAGNLKVIIQNWDPLFWDSLRKDSILLPFSPSAEFAQALAELSGVGTLTQAKRALKEATRMSKPPGLKGQRRTPRTVQPSDAHWAIQALRDGRRWASPSESAYASDDSPRASKRPRRSSMSVELPRAMEEDHTDDPRASLAPVPIAQRDADDGCHRYQWSASPEFTLAQHEDGIDIGPSMNVALDASASHRAELEENELDELQMHQEIRRTVADAKQRHHRRQKDAEIAAEALARANTDLRAVEAETRWKFGLRIIPASESDLAGLEEEIHRQSASATETMAAAEDIAKEVRALYERAAANEAVNNTITFDTEQWSQRERALHNKIAALAEGLVVIERRKAAASNAQKEYEHAETLAAASRRAWVALLNDLPRG